MRVPLGVVFGGGWNQQGQSGIGAGATLDSVMNYAMEPGPDVFTAIAAGFDHSLALGADGTVWAWGQWKESGSAGQTKPVQLSFLESIIAVSAGHFFSLALRADGIVWSWGTNERGQLGDGTKIPKPKQAVQVQGLKNIVAIATGWMHGLALDGGGRVWGWGLNDQGQLGDGSITSSGVVAPVQVVNLDRVIAIAGGAIHSLALRADGTVWAWGANQKGQLGDGSTVQHVIPKQVPTLGEVVAIAAGGEHSLALKVDSTVLAWGDNGVGQLGNDTTVDSPSPTTVLTEAGSTEPLRHVIAIDAYDAHSLAILADNQALAWGYNNSGRLCDGTEINRLTPIKMQMVSGLDWTPVLASAVAGGTFHSLAILQTGRTWGWGHNGSKQLSDSLGGDDGAAVRLEVWNYRQGVAAGALHSMGIADLCAVSWGANDQQQADPNDSTGQPVGVTSGPPAIAVAAGEAHSLVLLPGGQVRSWGANDRGQCGGLGVATVSPQPVLTVKGPRGDGWLTGVKAIAAGAAHSLALKADGTVWAWGANDRGQLGDGSPIDNRGVPVPVKGENGVGVLSDIVAIAAGAHFSMALRADGTVWAWGANNTYQLTYPHALHLSRTPLPLAGYGDDPPKMKAIAAGAAHGLALTADGKVHAWGWNNRGQLGNGSTVSTYHAAPVKLGPTGHALLELVKAIAAGGKFEDIEDSYGSHSLALLASGQVLGWGWNMLGQLALLNNADPEIHMPEKPVKTWVEDPSLPPGTAAGVPLTRVATLAAGYFHSLAIGSAEQELPD